MLQLSEWYSSSIAALQTVWSLADLFMGLMVFTNLIAISFLSKFAYAALVDYMKQKKQGKDPVFVASSIPGLQNTECWDGQDVEENKKLYNSSKRFKRESEMTGDSSRWSWILLKSGGGLLRM